MLLCDGKNFAGEDGEYIVTLNVSAVYPDSNALFWFDYITYIPSPSVPLGSATLLVDRLDQAIVYSSGWHGPTSLYPYGMETQTSGSQFKFNFTGTSVTCVGYIPLHRPFPGQPLPLDPILAYTVDTTSINSTDLSNYIYFSTPQLSPGLHSLEVTALYNHTDGDRTPVTLNHLIIDNALSPSTTPSPSSPPTDPPPPSPAVPSITVTVPHNKLNASTPIGAMVWSIIGTMVLCLGAFLLWRYNRRRRIGHLSIGLDDPIELRLITPFDATSSRPSTDGHTRKGYRLNSSSGISDPYPVPHGQSSNRRKGISSGTPPLIGIAHEDSDTGGDRLDGPSVIPEPYLILHAQSSNRRKGIPSRDPLIDIAHDDSDTRGDHLNGSSVIPDPYLILHAQSSNRRKGIPSRAPLIDIAHDGGDTRGDHLNDSSVIPDPYLILHAQSSNRRKGIPSGTPLVEIALEDGDITDLPPSYNSQW
ncbi:hypothetical protein BD779DRAFT_1676756 [Infundibulicybe gibba]|nr:hypothetical protein BD779DRAFT_1676756 [Infundibulicybe gibba]